MPDISITVADKIAHAAGSPVIVCGNSDYVINFTLDSEWDSYDKKTARFEYAADGELKYQDVVFSGLSVSAPIITGAAFGVSNTKPLPVISGAATEIEEG